MRLIRKHIPFVLAKVEDDGDPLNDRIIEGYASTFESPERHDSHGDIILPGAFKQAIDEHEAGGYQVKLFLRHQTGIGVMLKMVEDAKGLFIRARISETREGDDALTLVRDGVLDSFSIAFVIESEDDFQDLAVMTKWGYPVRAFKRIPLKENSLLEIPSNEFARVTQVRSDRLTHYKARVAHQLEVEQQQEQTQEQKTIDEEREERRVEAQLAARCRKCVKLGALVTKLVASHVDEEYSEEDVLEFIAMSAAIELEALKEIMSGEAVEPMRSALNAIAGALDVNVYVLVKAIEDDGAALGEELEAEVEAVEVEVEDAPLEVKAISEDDSIEETNTNASAEIEAAVAAFQDIISLISCST